MPRKLGQHFLHRQDLLRRIAGAACAGATRHIIEIGPGRGALTEHLLAGPAKVTAIEIDTELASLLRDRFASSGNFQLVHADVLEVDMSSMMPAVVVGNLPYYITSPIIEKVLGLGNELEYAVFLIQREVADRLSAGPGSRDYGYLSVHTQLLASAETLFKVPPGAFSPPPKVDSAVVRLTPRPDRLTDDPRAFLQFASACFRQKRKTLRNNLRELYPAIAAHDACRLRAEQLSIEALVTLFDDLR